MTYLGTRPPTVDEWEQYELHHRSRMSTKPGITGMWQVSGRSDITDFIVDDEVKICGIKENTKFNLSNIYAIKYWLPMRSDSPETIKLSENESNSYTVKRQKKEG